MRLHLSFLFAPPLHLLRVRAYGGKSEGSAPPGYRTITVTSTAVRISTVTTTFNRNRCRCCRRRYSYR
ncbi:hypothetical protein VTK56DRAFT_2214 [Thermocarpiscus australiensis]